MIESEKKFVLCQVQNHQVGLWGVNELIINFALWCDKQKKLVIINN